MRGLNYLSKEYVCYLFLPTISAKLITLATVATTFGLAHFRFENMASWSPILAITGGVFTTIVALAFHQLRFDQARKRLVEKFAHQLRVESNQSPYYEAVIKRFREKTLAYFDQAIEPIDQKIMVASQALTETEQAKKLFDLQNCKPGRRGTLEELGQLVDKHTRAARKKVDELEEKKRVLEELRNHLGEELANLNIVSHLAQAVEKLELLALDDNHFEEASSILRKVSQTLEGLRDQRIRYLDEDKR